MARLPLRTCGLSVLLITTLILFFRFSYLLETATQIVSRKHSTHGRDFSNYGRGLSKRADIPSASDDVYNKAVEKGDILICWMKNPSLAGDQATSQWNDYADIAKWGWTDTTGGNWLGESSPGIKDLVPKAADLTSADKTFRVGHTKSAPDQVIEGTTYHYPATNAVYENNLYPESGVIVANYNWGPNMMIQDETTSKGTEWDPATDKKPDLNQLSDFWWLGWKQYASSSQVSSLRYIVQHNIVNEPTQQVLARVLKMHWLDDDIVKQGKAPTWPGKVIDPTMDGFSALIGVPSVWGIPFMLIQHHTELGNLEVKKITAFTEVISPAYYQPNLIVELGPVDSDS